MLLEIAIGSFAAIPVLYAFWGLSRGAVECRKTIDAGRSKVTIKANRQIRHLTVSDIVAGYPITFNRAGVAKGEKLEFIYPFSNEKAKIIIEDEKGSRHIDAFVS